MNGITEGYSYNAIYELMGGAARREHNRELHLRQGRRPVVVDYFSRQSVHSSNELTSDATFTYQYDNNGSMTSKTDANAATTGYTWDFENRLTSVVLPGTGGVVSIKYDPLGRRIQKSSSSGTTNYVYDGASIADEYDANGSVLAQYAQGAGIDEPLAMSRSGTIAY